MLFLNFILYKTCLYDFCPCLLFSLSGQESHTKIYPIPKYLGALLLSLLMFISHGHLNQDGKCYLKPTVILANKS